MAQFLGREAEIEHLCALLADPFTRMVNVVGPGGVGKTTLLHRVTATLDEDRAVFVGLRSLTRSDDVIGAVADALGIPDAPGDARMAALAPALVERLVVLDNLEHLDGVGAIITSLLALDPTVHVLCSSRMAVDAPAEHIVTLDPLTGETTRALFAACAAARAEGVDAETVDAICEATGGLPLAVELAAARLSVLTPKELAARAGADPRALGGALDASAAWSHDLLSFPAVVVFRRMAVFLYERSVADIEHVAAAGASDVGGDVLDALEELVKSSLVMRVERDDRSWFSMLPPIHAFAAARLDESGERLAIEDARVAWAIAATTAARQDIATVRHEEGLASFEAMAGELREIARGLLASSPQVVAHLIGMQRPFWFFRGRVSDAEELSTRLLDRASVLAPFERARVFAVAGDCATARGNMQEALHFAKEAAVAAEELGDNLPLLGEVYSGVGRAARNAGDFAEAVRAGRRCVEVADARDEPRNRLVARSNLASFLAWTDDSLDEASSLIEAVLADDSGALSLLDRSITLGQSVDILLRCDRLEEAVERATEWSALSRQTSNDMGVVEALLSRAQALADLERFDESLADADAARALAQTAEDPRTVAVAVLRRATALAGLGDRDRALQAFYDALVDANLFDAGLDMRGMLAHIGQVSVGLLPDEVALTLVAASPSKEMPAALARRLEPKRVRAVVERAEAMTDAALVDAAMRALQAYLAGAAGAANLTARERDVLRAITRGLTDKEIAAELTLSVRTVTTHVGKVLAKLGVPTRTAAASKALQLDLV